MSGRYTFSPEQHKKKENDSYFSECDDKHISCLGSRLSVWKRSECIKTGLEMIYGAKVSVSFTGFYYKAN